MTRTPEFSIHFGKQDEHLADELSAVVDKTASILKRLLDLDPRRGIEIYIMRSWVRFIFRAAPFPRKVIQLVLFPLLYPSYSRAWKVAGGWNIPFGKTTAVGVKPPALIAQSKSKLGDSIFEVVNDSNIKFAHIVCHEFTHAMTSTYALPNWLNEGLAMVVVDELHGKPTVKRESLLVLNQDAPNASNKVSRRDVRRCYIRGYWLTRYLLEMHPHFLIELFNSDSQAQSEIESQIANMLEISHEDFWATVSPMLVEHFG